MFKCPLINKNQIEKSSNVEIFMTASIQNPGRKSVKIKAMRYRKMN